MASPDFEYPWISLTGESFSGSSNVLRKEEDNPAYILTELEVSSSSVSCNSCNIPSPPPLTSKSLTRAILPRRLTNWSTVPRVTIDIWDKLFKECYDADVYIATENNSYVCAHSNVLSSASPVLKHVIQQSKKLKNGIRHIKISGVPYEAVYTFIRFLYSSCYDEEEMNKFVLHLLVLSHSYSVPSLKGVCVDILEHGWLTKNNLIDVLQLARSCDSPRLVFICTRMVLKDFRSVSSTAGWKVMKRANPALEQELLESVVEADSRKEERLKKKEDQKVYLQLHEAMEALVHICRDGCRTIGPRDKVLKGSSHMACEFSACKGLETLVRHFSSCKIRVPGGCVHCKRMWQLLELHSRMCDDPELCKVPLCRHFKEKIQRQSKREEAKWKLLVTKVISARNFLGPYAARTLLNKG